MSGYVDELAAERTIESEGRLENLSELMGVAADFETIDEFLEQVSLVADTDSLDDAESAVTLMTLHAAKGLEYPVVFILGMEDGIFPSHRTLTEPDQMEEERRLAYVGITRARERLYVSSATSRMLHGSTQYNPPSRFLDEIPMVLVDELGSPRRSGRRSSRSGDAWSHRDSWSAGSDSSTSGRVFGGGGGSTGGSSGESALRPAAAPKPSGAEQIDFRVGDDLRHSQWGEGVILELRGIGDDAQATVRFSSSGAEKVLLLKWAPVEKI